MHKDNERIVEHKDKDFIFITHVSSGLKVEMRISDFDKHLEQFPEVSVIEVQTDIETMLINYVIKQFDKYNKKIVIRNNIPIEGYYEPKH